MRPGCGEVCLIPTTCISCNHATNIFRYLQAEKAFSKIEVFDQRATAGGLWNYTPLHVVDSDFTIPRTKPSDRPDTLVHDTSNAEEAPPVVVSPVYDQLETNIPHTLMNYCDQTFPQGSALFPQHAVVQKYLHRSAENVAPLLSLETQVLDVRRRKATGDYAAVWEIDVQHVPSGTKRTAEFDAVVVANGHYNDPFVPDIAGLAAFNEAHPGVVTHSKFYRRPDPFKGQKVIVVGNSASGIDLSAQIATVAQAPVLVSEKEKPNPSTPSTPAAAPVDNVPPPTRNVPEIVEFLPAQRGVRFADGVVEINIDAVVFCTGYFYSFPFLRSLDPPVVVADGSHVPDLYEHILTIHEPTLAFLGIPQRIVPFPVAEAQSAWVARLFSGRLPLPSIETMKSWEAALVAERGIGKQLHNLAFPRDVTYINQLHDRSMEAARNPSLLSNDGVGKLPPYWGPEKAWVRERFPMIKLAARALGEKRHGVQTLEQLGFDYHARAASAEAGAGQGLSTEESTDAVATQ